MKYFEDFTRSGNSFAERIGQPDELDAAIGRIALGFSYLEDTARNVIVLLSGAHPEIGNVMVAELSFRQKLNVLGSLVRQRIHPSSVTSNAPDAESHVDELLNLCHRAEELRNTYLHSSYDGSERAKLSAKARHGLRIHREHVDSALLLDVADYIVYAGMELESLPILVDVADLVTGGPGFLSYSKNGSIVATFKFGYA
jgi:hypothetical protein